LIPKHRDEGVIRGTTLISAFALSLTGTFIPFPCNVRNTSTFSHRAVSRSGFSRWCSWAAFLLLIYRIAPTSGSLENSQGYSSHSSHDYFIKLDYTMHIVPNQVKSGIF